MSALKGMLGVLLLTVGIGIAHANEGGGHGGGEGGSPGMIAMEPMVVNLKESHYVQIRPILKLADPAKTEEVKVWTPVMRHELIKFIIDRDPAEVAGPQFMKEFSGDATALLNKALPEKYIKDVLFDSWIVQ